jgi:hypothetical protein
MQTEFPFTYNITIYQGDTWEKAFTIAREDPDTGVDAPYPSGTLTWKGQVYDRTNSVKLCDVSVVVTTDATKHNIYCSISSTVSTLLPIKKGKWDVQASRASDGFKKTILAGDVIIVAEVTRL